MLEFLLKINIINNDKLIFIEGFEGERGPKGEIGYPGGFGAPGLDGRPGPRGEKGPDAPRELPKGYVYALHSQSTEVPSCPNNAVKLWEGYSLASMVGSSRAAGQDLGAAGSCMQQFSTMPFMFCGINDVCSYAQNNDDSLWLSTNEDMPTDMAPIKAEALQKYISRCSVCEFKTRLIAIHLQDMLGSAKCPDNWTEAWTGYSYLMVRTP